MANFPGFNSPAYGQIGGALPWGVGGNPISGLGGNNPVGALAASYDRNYGNALAMNKSNYDNIMAGYGQTMGSQQQAQQGIYAGYGGLQDRVMGLLDTQGNSQNQAIQDQYAAQLGAQSQQLINRGLGNTTVQSSVARGNLLDRTKALNQNNEMTSGLKARYLSDLGLQGLQAQREGYAANTGLAGRQLGFMADANFKYPDAGMYASLASQYGGGRGGYGSGMGAPVGGGGAAPGLGYAPRGGPGYYDSGRDPGVMGGGGGYNAFGGGGGGFDGYSSPYADSGDGYSEGSVAGGDYTGASSALPFYGAAGGMADFYDSGMGDYGDY